MKQMECGIKAEEIEVCGKPYIILEIGEPGGEVHYFSLFYGRDITKQRYHVASVPEYYMARNIAMNHARTGQRY